MCASSSSPFGVTYSCACAVLLMDPSVMHMHAGQVFIPCTTNSWPWSCTAIKLLALIMQEWNPIGILSAIKGTSNGVSELWEDLQSSPRLDALHLCKKALGDSPPVLGFVRKFLRYLSVSVSRVISNLLEGWSSAARSRLTLHTCIHNECPVLHVCSVISLTCEQ